MPAAWHSTSRRVRRDLLLSLPVCPQTRQELTLSPLSLSTSLVYLYARLRITLACPPTVFRPRPLRQSTFNDASSAAIPRPTAFQCEVTGHSNLDYFQACRSEEREARLLHERFPSKLKGPLLRAVQFRQSQPLDASHVCQGALPSKLRADARSLCLQNLLVGWTS